MTGLGIALRAETYVSLRNWKLWGLLAAPALAAVIRLLLVQINAASENLRQSLGSDNTLATQEYAYGYFVDALNTGLIFIYLLFIALAALSFAVERDQGTVRHLVIRQSSRHAIITAKILWLHCLALLAFLLVFFCAWAICTLMWDFGPVVEDGYELISVAEIHTEIRQGLLLALIPLPACLGFGLMLSIIANSALQAVTLGLGLSLLLDIFKGALGNIAHFLYINYQPSLLDNSYLNEVARIARGFSDILIDEHLLQLNYWLPLPQAVLFFAIAWVLVGRKSL